MRLLATSMFCALTCLAQVSNLPSGTQVRIRLGQTVTSEKARSGDTWSGTIADDLVVNGATVARRGDPVRGRVTDARPPGGWREPPFWNCSSHRLMEVQ